MLNIEICWVGEQNCIYLLHLDAIPGHLLPWIQLLSTSLLVSLRAQEKKGSGLGKREPMQRKGSLCCPHLFVICELPSEGSGGGEGPRDGGVRAGKWVACWVGSGGAWSWLGGAAGRGGGTRMNAWGLNWENKATKEPVSLKNPFPIFSSLLH